ncbi:hypothetical protein BKA70DRAFT_1233516 [Coprinopsis sp. MPI-PUGE-AT-0042]|nr:hypothetical protein BKA70DRAFT_1233516 [Coprinopsis sp. MPI-PUGE-AT-0042]
MVYHPFPDFYMEPIDFKTPAFKLRSVDREDHEEEATVRRIARVKGDLLKPYDFDIDFTEVMYFFVPTLARIYLDNLGRAEEADFFKRLKKVAELWYLEGDLNGFPSYKKKLRSYIQRVKEAGQEVAQKTTDHTIPFARQIPLDRLDHPWRHDFDSIDQEQHKLSMEVPKEEARDWKKAATPLDHEPHWEGAHGSQTTTSSIHDSMRHWPM